MIPAFVAGVAAGYGIAIPVGAIAILIIETGLRRGFRLAAAAGAGAAAADGIYAVVAAVFGAALAAVIAPVAAPLQVVAVVVLVAIAVRGLWRLRATPATATVGPTIPAGVEDAERRGSAGRTFAVFLGLTLLNPITVAYFAALILGLTATGVGAAEKAAFVGGAFAASLSWQILLAGFGSFLHRRLPPAARTSVIVLGNGIILAFAAVIAVDLAG